MLQELGIEVSVERKLPGVEGAYRDHLRRLRDEQRVGMIKPSTDQAKVKAMFPAVEKWVREYGYIEIGVQELVGFVARALHEGGTQVEDDRPATLAEALAALEAGLARWFEEQGGGVD